MPVQYFCPCGAPKDFNSVFCYKCDQIDLTKRSVEIQAYARFYNSLNIYDPAVQQAWQIRYWSNMLYNGSFELNCID